MKGKIVIFLVIAGIVVTVMCGLMDINEKFGMILFCGAGLVGLYALFEKMFLNKE